MLGLVEENVNRSVKILPGILYDFMSDDGLVRQIGGKEAAIAEVVDFPRNAFSKSEGSLESLGSEGHSLATRHGQAMLDVVKRLFVGKGSESVAD